MNRVVKCSAKEKKITKAAVKKKHPTTSDNRKAGGKNEGGRKIGGRVPDTIATMSKYFLKVSGTRSVLV